MSGNTPIGGPNLEHSSPPQPPRPGSGPQGGSATRQHIIRYLRKLHNWLDEWSAADTERLADASAAFVSTVVQEGGLSAGSLDTDFRDADGNCQEVTGISILELCNGSSLTDTSDGEFRMEQSDDTTLANLTLNNLVSDGGTITLDNGTTTIGSGELNLLDGMTGKTGADTNFATGTAGTGGNLAEWNGDGDLVGSGKSTGDLEQNLFESVAADSGSNTVADSATDTLTITGGAGISTSSDPSADSIRVTNDSPNVDQNLWDTVTGDSGTASPDSTSDTLNFEGGDNIVTTVTDDPENVKIDMSPAGSDDEIQLNDSGFLATDSEFVYNRANNTLGIGTSSPDTSALAHLNGSGGDAVFRMDSTSADVKMTQTVLGAQDWAIGADNSDSAAYKIANSTELSTNTALRIDPSTQALQFNGAYEFPTSDGSANQVLQTDGSGNLDFADATGTDTYKIPLLWKLTDDGGNLSANSNGQVPTIRNDGGTGSLHTLSTTSSTGNTGTGNPQVGRYSIGFDMSETGGSSSHWVDFCYPVGIPVNTIDSATSATLKCRLRYVPELKLEPPKVAPNTFKLAWGDTSSNANYSTETSNVGTSFSTISTSMGTTGLTTADLLWAGFTWEIAASARVDMRFEALWIEVEV